MKVISDILIHIVMKILRNSIRMYMFMKLLNDWLIH